MVENATNLNPSTESTLRAIADRLDVPTEIQEGDKSYRKSNAIVRWTHHAEYLLQNPGEQVDNYFDELTAMSH